MKILVTGSKGQLGTDVSALLKKQNIEVIGADLPETDITDISAVRAAVESASPDAVIHLAAYTAVDKAESEKELCTAVNVKGTENVARVCSEKGIKMLYTSTDYIFAGKGTEPFEVDSPVSPCNHYGKTKYEGEEAVRRLCTKHFIVRISWVFGVNGKNFVYTMLRLAQTKSEIPVVCDQIGSPTFTPDLSVLIADMIKTEKYGTYHATNEGLCSWAEFAGAIMKKAGKSTKIIPILSADYPSAAQRPLNSRLSKSSLDKGGFDRLPPWEDALDRFLRAADIIK